MTEEQVSMKITCWTYNGKRFGQPYLLSVSAETLEDAVEQLEAMGEPVPCPDEVRPTTMISGHDRFPEAVEYHWELEGPADEDEP